MNSLIPNAYRPPLGLPLRWQDDQSGELPAAVMAYHARFLEPNAPQPNDRQIEIIVAWLQHYINAPCWAANPHLDADGRAALERLRARAGELTDVEGIEDFVTQCMAIGLDPF